MRTVAPSAFIDADTLDDDLIKSVLLISSGLLLTFPTPTEALCAELC